MSSSQYISRPGLEKIFTKNIYGDKDKRKKMTEEAVYRYGYKQKQIADHLGMHFTSISRILNKRDDLLKYVFRVRLAKLQLGWSYAIFFMARPPRIEFPGALYHVIVRGNRKQDIFHPAPQEATAVNPVRDQRSYGVKPWSGVHLRLFLLICTKGLSVGGR